MKPKIVYANILGRTMRCEVVPVKVEQGKIFGHDWETIKAAQRKTGSLSHGIVDTTKPASRNYYCDRCEKYFKPTGAIELGIQCPKCGFVVVL